MTGLIYFLIIFFIFLISYQVFLAYFSGCIEGLANNTSTTTTTTSTSSKKPTPIANGVSTSSNTSKTPVGKVTTSTGTTSNAVTPTTSSSTINASAINSDNIAYKPYTSTSESVPSLVGQNVNNILYLKEKVDSLFQQVQDISGNVTGVNNVQNVQAAQYGKTNEIIKSAQSNIQNIQTPTVSGLN